VTDLKLLELIIVFIVNYISSV